MNRPTCTRGDVWLVNFNPGPGSEQRGIRPALIIQNDIGNRYGATTIVAAITTTLKEYPVTVLLDSDHSGLKTKSIVNLAQLLTIDRARLRRRLGEVSDELMRRVDGAISVSLGLS